MVLTVAEGNKSAVSDMTGLIPRVQQLLTKVAEGDADLSALRDDAVVAVLQAMVPVLAHKLKDKAVREECLLAQEKAVPHLYALQGKKMFVQLARTDAMVFEFRLTKPFLLYLAFLVRAGIFLDGLPFSSRIFSWCVDRLFGPEEEGATGPASSRAGQSMAARLAASGLARRLATFLVARVSRSSEEHIKRDKVPGFWIDPEWLLDLMQDELPYRKGPQLAQKGVVFAMSAIEQGNSFRMKGLVEFVEWFGGWKEMWDFLANGALIPMFAIFTSDTYRKLGESLPPHLDALLEKYGC